MGVIYKLTDEVIQFIISQRQDNPLFSCRQLAESASQKFGLNLSKSSVHDVLKEAGVITPRGRKPKTTFKIPLEKKNQIQVSLSQVKLLPGPIAAEASLIADVLESPPISLGEEKNVNPILPKSASNPGSSAEQNPASNLNPITEKLLLNLQGENFPENKSFDGQKVEKKIDVEISSQYEGAGKIFFKAALWDIGIFSQENIKETDWNYYLTYVKGIKVALENSKDFFIDLPLPIERSIRELADGLINNIKPFFVDKVSDEVLFKACMDAQASYKIDKFSIVDHNNHEIISFNNIVECKRLYYFKNRIFVESREKNMIERSKGLFFAPNIVDNEVVANIFNLWGFDTTSSKENTVTLLIDNTYENKAGLQGAADQLNRMYIRDDQDRLLNIKIQTKQ